jgi:hypothetical protein
MSEITEFNTSESTIKTKRFNTLAYKNLFTQNYCLFSISMQNSTRLAPAIHKISASNAEININFL